jgi:hypothetical protein
LTRAESRRAPLHALLGGATRRHEITGLSRWHEITGLSRWHKTVVLE